VRQSVTAGFRDYSRPTGGRGVPLEAFALLSIDVNNGFERFHMAMLSLKTKNPHDANREGFEKQLNYLRLRSTTAKAPKPAKASVVGSGTVVMSKLITLPDCVSS